MARYDVELLGFEGEADVAGLARTFGLDEATARAVVASVPRVVKRDLDEAEAEHFFHALRELGGRVKLHRMTPLSTAPPPAAALPVPDFGDAPPAAVGLHPSSAPPPVGAAGALAVAIPLPAGVPDEPRATVAEVPLGEDRGGFVASLAKAYLHPFQPMLPVVVLGVALISSLVGYIPWVGAILAAGVWVGAVFTATKYASVGRDDLPGMEFDGFWELALPGIRFLLALFVPAILLAVLYGVLSAGSASAEAMMTGDASFSLAGAPLLFLVALGLWLVYLPASLILAAHSTGCLGGLNLVAGVLLIVREPVGYALTVAAAAPAAILVAVTWTVGSVIDQSTPIPFVVGFATDAVSLVPAIVGGRILGLFIWHHEHELGLA